MARATVADIHEFASSMPGATAAAGGSGIYQVRGKSFVFFRNPRPDAVDPATGERYADVVVFWVDSDEAKRALISDDATPFFTTPHFDGHTSVLLRHSRVGELTREELSEIVYDAWLARAPKRLAQQWLADHGLQA